MSEDHQKPGPTSRGVPHRAMRRRFLRRAIAFVGALVFFRIRIAKAGYYNLGGFWKKVTGGSTSSYLFSWGVAADAGQASTFSSPTQVGVATNWSKVVAAPGDTSGWGLAVRADNTLWAWGSNATGQLGTGDTVTYASPVQSGSATSDWSTKISTATHTIALKTDNSLWTWGNNSKGNLGNGNITQTETPAQIGTETNWSMVAAGRHHCLALRSTGALYVWGDNLNGKLGKGDVVLRSSPVQLGVDGEWKAIGRGNNASFAIKTSDGSLWAWGENWSGNLGVGDLAHRSSPVQVGVATGWKSVTGHSFSTVGIKDDGTLWTWGLNSNGELGLGDTANRSTPVQVGSGTTWSVATMGAGFTHALKTDKTLWGWGNGIAALGTGALTSVSTPVQIGTDSNWLDITDGLQHASGIKN